jgi:hypothetical protein
VLIHVPSSFVAVALVLAGCTGESDDGKSSLPPPTAPARRRSPRSRAPRTGRGEGRDLVRAQIDRDPVAARRGDRGGEGQRRLGPS